MDIEERLKKLEKQVNFLSEKRITQVDVLPQVIKTRHMGEANRYIYFGLEADLPTGFNFNNSTLAYFAYDTDKLYLYNGTAWVSTTLA